MSEKNKHIEVSVGGFNEALELARNFYYTLADPNASVKDINLAFENIYSVSRYLCELDPDARKLAMEVVTENYLRELEVLNQKNDVFDTDPEFFFRVFTKRNTELFSESQLNRVLNLDFRLMFEVLERNVGFIEGVADHFKNLDLLAESISFSLGSEVETMFLEGVVARRFESFIRRQVEVIFEYRIHRYYKTFAEFDSRMLARRPVDRLYAYLRSLDDFVEVKSEVFATGELPFGIKWQRLLDPRTGEEVVAFTGDGRIVRRIPIPQIPVLPGGGVQVAREKKPFLEINISAETRRDIKRVLGWLRNR